MSSPESGSPLFARTRWSLVRRACGSTPDSSAGATDRTSAARASGVAVQGDVMFAQMMVPHHEQAVEMAKLALDARAGASDQVRALAAQIAAAQGPEIATMQRWLAWSPWSQRLTWLLLPRLSLPLLLWL